MALRNQERASGHALVVYIVLTLTLTAHSVATNADASTNHVYQLMRRSQLNRQSLPQTEPLRRVHEASSLNRLLSLEQINGDGTVVNVDQKQAQPANLQIDHKVTSFVGSLGGVEDQEDVRPETSGVSLLHNKDKDVTKALVQDGEATHELGEALVQEGAKVEKTQAGAVAEEGEKEEVSDGIEEADEEEAEDGNEEEDDEEAEGQDEDEEDEDIEKEEEEEDEEEEKRRKRRNGDQDEEEEDEGDEAEDDQEDEDEGQHAEDEEEDVATAAAEKPAKPSQKKKKDAISKKPAKPAKASGLSLLQTSSQNKKHAISKKLQKASTSVRTRFSPRKPLPRRSIAEDDDDEGEMERLEKLNERLRLEIEKRTEFM